MTVQMFVSCGGLQALVQLLTPTAAGADGEDEESAGADASVLSGGGVEEADAPQALRATALTCIAGMFSAGLLPKNEFSRLFHRAGALPRLAGALRGVGAELAGAPGVAYLAGGDGGGGIAAAYADAQVALDLLVQFSQADAVVKCAVASSDVLHGAARALLCLIWRARARGAYAGVRRTAAAAGLTWVRSQRWCAVSCPRRRRCSIARASTRSR